ncbi:MAG: hypothetical protein EPO06_10670 [Burkholderiaceae bacterium]|nr:MAG: hypothetical protein EPO06_10670 [Burkholderiaceae bacterium]
MRSDPILNALCRLAKATTTETLNESLEQSLLPLLQPSSLVLAWGRRAPHFTMAPVYASAGFPEGLLHSFRITDPFFAIPLLDSLNVDEPPRHAQISHLVQEEHKLWWGIFKQKGFEKLYVAGSTDLRSKYLTYLCATDIQLNHDLSADAVCDLLGVLTPVLHDTLGRIRREKKRLKEKRGDTLLSPREQEILGWVRKGKTNAEISAILGISFPTIKNHVQNIINKLNVSNRAAAVDKAFGPSDETTMLNTWMAQD